MNAERGTFAPSRRSFLGGALALTAVAAIPKGLQAADLPMLHGDGIGDDTAALNAMFSGKPFRTADGFAGIAKAGRLTDCTLRITDTIKVSGGEMFIDRCTINAEFPDDRSIVFIKNVAVVGISECQLNFHSTGATP